MIDAARSRMRNMGGSPNEAAARVLVELVAEEDAYIDYIEEEDTADVFEALVNEYHAEPQLNTEDTMINRSTTMTSRFSPARADSSIAVSTR
jgi:hypothetical protein